MPGTIESIESLTDALKPRYLGQRVTDVRVEDDWLVRFEFENGASLSLCMPPEGLQAVEEDAEG